MEREKFKLDEKVMNKRELLKVIEEKEIQIENQKLKLKLANEEIEKIKIELRELKKDINDSIIDRVDNVLEEKKNKSFIRSDEKENNIAIEIVEIDEDKYIDKNKAIDDGKSIEESINKIMNEVTNYEEKQNINEIATEELVVNTIEEEEETKDKLILIENLKSVFIENKNYQSIEILNEILGEIEFIEANITNEEKILLLYLGYFYNKLEELLEKSKVINEFYYSDVNEVKLLIMLIQEKEYPIYQQEKETVSMKIIDNKNLFNGLDTILRGRIIDKIKSISYKVFDGITFPSFITRITSASRIVDRRCATINVVRPSINFVKAACIFTSVLVSIDDVASSRISIGGLHSITRAMHKSCFCPCDSPSPSSVTHVSYPFGRRRITL